MELFKITPKTWTNTNNYLLATKHERKTSKGIIGTYYKVVKRVSFITFEEIKKETTSLKGVEYNSRELNNISKF